VSGITSYPRARFARTLPDPPALEGLLTLERGDWLDALHSA